MRSRSQKNNTAHTNNTKIKANQTTRMPNTPPKVMTVKAKAMAPLPKRKVRSRFIKSVLLPGTGPASIPDTIMRRHHLKSEPITYNQSVTTSDGLFILYPNAQDDIIGYAYKGSGHLLVLDKEIRTAQYLPANFDLSRKISQYVKIKSSTTAAGTFQLGGTFNAVTYEGPLSDMDLSYNGLISMTTDPFDRVENVPVYDGVSSLMLPVTFNKDYIHLNDPVLSAKVVNNVGSVSMAESGNSTTIVIESGNPGGDGHFGSLTPNHWYDPTNHDSFVLADFPVDLVPDQNFTINGWCELWDQDNTAACYVDNIGVFVDFYNIANQRVAFEEISLTTSSSGPAIPMFWANTIGSPHSYRIPISYSMNLRNMTLSKKALPDQPIVRAVISLGMMTQTIAPSNLAAHAEMGFTIADSKSSSHNSQVTVIAYTGASNGQTLTLSGCVNYELIPNANLQKNINMEYAYADRYELEYMQDLLAFRHDLGIRSIYPTSDYESMMAILHEYSTLDDNTLASALDFGDIIRFIKNKALPALRVVPGSVGQVAGGISDIWRAFD